MNGRLRPLPERRRVVREHEPPRASTRPRSETLYRAAAAAADAPAAAASADPGGAVAADAASDAGGSPPPGLLVVLRLGTLLTQLMQQTQRRGGWSASLPLDRELLPATVLHLVYNLDVLRLEFVSDDWNTREFLRPHLPLLAQMLRQSLSSGCDVIVSV